MMNNDLTQPRQRKYQTMSALALCTIVGTTVLAYISRPKPQHTPQPTMLVTSKASSKTLENSSTDVKNLPTAPIRIYEINEDKSEKLISEVWIRGNKTRVDTKRRLQGQYIEKSSKYSDETISYTKKEGVIYKYEPDRKVAHIEKNTELVEGYPMGPDYWTWIFLRNEKTFDISYLTEKNKYEKVNKITYQGRPANEIISYAGERFMDRRRIEFSDSTPEDKEHFNIWIDHRNSKKTVARLEVDIGMPFPDTIFDTNYPKDTQIWEYNKEKTIWDERLKKPIATLQLEDRTFNILNVQRNQYGHIFLLYTYVAGEASPNRRTEAIYGTTTDWKLTLTDSNGRHYIPASKSESESEQHILTKGSSPLVNDHPKSYVFNENPTAFSWFIPCETLTPQEAKRPAALHLEITAALPRVTKGDDWKYYQGRYNASMHRPGRYVAGTLSFPDVPICQEQPSYMKLLNDKRLPQEALELLAAKKRQEYWLCDAPYSAPQDASYNRHQAEKSDEYVRRLTTKYPKSSGFPTW
jgi:hypothetical protein